MPVISHNSFQSHSSGLHSMADTFVGVEQRMFIYGARHVELAARSMPSLVRKSIPGHGEEMPDTLSVPPASRLNWPVVKIDPELLAPVRGQLSPDTSAVPMIWNLWWNQKTNASRNCLFTCFLYLSHLHSGSWGEGLGCWGQSKLQTYSKRPDIWNTRMIVQEKCQKLSGQWEL